MVIDKCVFIKDKPNVLKFDPYLISKHNTTMPKKKAYKQDDLFNCEILMRAIRLAQEGKNKA